MIGNHESTKRAGHLLCALLRLRKSVCGGKIQRGRRCGIQTQPRSASDTSVCIAITTETAEGICCRVDSAGEVEDDHLLKLGVEISCRGPQSVLVKCLIDARIKGDRTIWFQARIAKDGETKETIERGAKAFKKRWRPVTVADMSTYFCT